jgi:hypothetical protein
MGMSIVSNESEAVIINDSVVPNFALPVVFSIYDSEATHGENIVELVNEFIDWCKPRDVRYLDVRDESYSKLRKEWERFLAERSADCHA